MSETDRQLKDKLNSNQSMRERMCLELLQNEAKFSNVRPRLPNGGPDGGRDIEADYDGTDRVFGAVGFVNNATDTNEHRNKIRKKFSDDLAEIKTATADERRRTPTVFVFFTNVGLTPGIIDALKKSAYEQGVIVCEVFDRERLRILLDRNSGYAIRYRYLDIPLSDAEQKDFFGTWGDQLQEMMTSNLTEIGSTTKRLVFLAEAQFLVDRISVLVKLDGPLGDISKDGFVFQAMVSLRVHAEGFLGVIFGAGSDPIVESIEEIRTTKEHFARNGQYGYALTHLISGSEQHDRHVEMLGDNEVDDDDESWLPAGSSHGILEIEKPYIHIDYGSTPFIERFSPTCRLIDLDRAFILFDCNADLAGHIEEIIVSANHFRILHLTRADFRFEPGRFDRFKLPQESHQKEDSHEWRTIRPSATSSCFTPDFIGRTPMRWTFTEV